MVVIVMAATSIFGDLVRLRFPNAEPVFGAGPYAILSRCPQRPFVRLFETAIEAQSNIQKDCGHAFCQMKHQFVNLAEQPAEPASLSHRRKAHWARFLEMDD